MLFLNHIPLVIENYHRTLRFSGVNFTNLIIIFETHPWAQGKETASPANVNCGIKTRLQDESSCRRVFKQRLEDGLPHRRGECPVDL